MKKMMILALLMLLSGCTVDKDELKEEIKTELQEELVFTVDDLNHHLIEVSDEIKSCTVSILTTLTDNSETIGSGVLFSKDGTTYSVLTNEHVIRYNKKVEVYLPSLNKYIEVNIIKEDSAIDLAQLNFTSNDSLNVCEINEQEYAVGEMVLSVGSSTSIDYANTVTLGIISRIDEHIQHDAAINNGNSGGPLFNMNGQIIGLNVSKINTSVSGNQQVFVEGMSFSIRLTDLIEFIAQ